MGKKLKSLEDVVRNGLCVSCGACANSHAENEVSLELNSLRGEYVPVLKKASAGEGAVFEVCPGRGYPIMAMSSQLFPKAKEVSLELGRYEQAWACHSTSEEVLKRASSGGVVTGIALYMLENEIVDGVVTTRFEYGESNGPRAVPFIARTKDDLFQGQGSKYCPTPTNTIVSQCCAEGGRYLFIGTPCQIAALRLTQKQNPDLKKTFPYTATNFCGGYRDYRELDYLLERNGVDSSSVVDFRFRGGGQPGSMRAVAKNGVIVEKAYPRYNSGAAFPKNNRCTFCVDATGVLADFSCGDAWLPKFQNGSVPWSVVILRSPQAVECFNKLKKAEKVTTTTITAEEIFESQKTNITSKIYRQKERMTIFKWLGRTLPEWDMKYPSGHTTLVKEFKISFSKMVRLYKDNIRRRLRLY
jgi:coenzyme F420 hydrogenase subunit beta